MISEPGVDPDLLWFGTHRVSHRGPDDWGFVCLAPFEECADRHRYWRRWEERQHASEYRIGLGSRRLSIVDLSEAGRQPMNLRGTDLWIIWNGEIYNYRELRDELAAEHCFTTETDTEVLLAAYEKWGTECLGRFNGMFALAIWDGARKRVLLARDRFGEKPLYYTHCNGRFVFASELKQFLEDNEFEREIDQSALADFLLLSLQDHDERSFYERVKQLPAAHWMEVDAVHGGTRGPYRYWTPEIADDLDTSRDRAFGEELPFLLRDSIRLRLRSDVQAGICLSGGLDSTTICSLAAEQMPDPASFPAYTMTFPGYAEDEFSAAAEVVGRTGVRHIHSTFRAHDLWERLQDFVYSQDGPTGGASTFASWRVFEAAREDGTVVLLNGQGGDELFAGYDKFYFFWLRNLLARGRWLRFSASAGSYFRKNGANRWNYAHGRRYATPFLRNRMMGIWQHSAPELQSRVMDKVQVGGEGLNQRLWKDMSEFSLPCLLHWEDRNSMAAGTEARLPFLDHRLAEAVLATSAYTKLRNGFTKYSLRRAMDDALPSKICWQRKKRGFETPARQWFRTDLAPQIKELLSSRKCPLAEFFEMDGLLAQFEGFEKRNSNSLTENEWFKLVGTCIWLEQLKSWSRRPAPEAAMATQ
ncbi:MAG: asparagine synthase (glutamine-hydrolyzing) [Candidatus Acidiferrales bacterium]